MFNSQMQKQIGLCFVLITDFNGVNIPTTANFKLPISYGHWMWSWEQVQ